jgi:predicted nucleotidyltransferase
MGAATLEPEPVGRTRLRERACAACGLSTALLQGPWGRAVGRRLVEALQSIVWQVSAIRHVQAVALFGSYARGEAGASSDVDLFVLMDTTDPPEQLPEGRQVIAACGDAEAAHRLPVHIAPLLVSSMRLAEVSEHLLRNVLADGVVLYGKMAHLAALVSPDKLTPMVVVSYSLGKQANREKVQLHRRLFGYKTAAGHQSERIVQPPGRRLGPGVVLIPLSQQTRVVRALREVGALFSEVPVWVPDSYDVPAGNAGSDWQ